MIKGLCVHIWRNVRAKGHVAQVLSQVQQLTLRRWFEAAWAILPRGQALITAFTKVAKGMAKNTPQNPHQPPKTNTATIIATGCKLTASENSNGT